MEFEGGDGEIEAKSMGVKVRSRVVREFEGGRGKIEGGERILGW